MRHRIIMMFLLLVSLMTACTTEDNLGVKNEVLIVGNERIGFLQDNGGSRSIESQLPAGSELSFYSTGAFVCEGDTLRYDGTEWKGNKKFFWQGAAETVTVHAYYPVWNANNASFYDANHNLHDVVYAEGTYESGSRINLQFHHLFPKITFKLAESINATASKVRFRIAKKIEAIDMYTTRLTLVDNADELISFEKSADATYSFLIPYSDTNIEVELIVLTPTGERRLSLANNFQKRTSYICNIKELSEKVPGIFTARDFLDFVTLYNGGTVQGRTLEDFYDKTKTEEGKKVFRLMNSLTFTPEESRQLKAIGRTEGNKKVFTDVFDGMNQTLHDVTLSNVYSFNPALFLVNKGIIRNLHIDRMTTVESRNAHSPSILCGENEGVIHNCMVTGSVIQYPDYLDQSFASLLVSYNKENGLIYNCGVEESSIKSPKLSGGGLAIDNKGVIRNSYVYKNTHAMGGNLCVNNFGTISISYVYGMKKEGVASLCFNQGKGIIDNCFRNDEYGGNMFDSTNNIVCYSYVGTNFGKVTMNNVEKNTLADALNYWIDNNVYEGISADLTRWTRAADGHPIFETQR